MTLHPSGWPLSRKILGLAILNLLLIAAVLLIYLQWHYGLQPESLLIGPNRDRIFNVANEVNRTLRGAPWEDRNVVLADLSSLYGIDIFVTGPHGEALDGSPLTLPEAVTAAVTVGGDAIHKTQGDKKGKKGKKGPKGGKKKGPKGGKGRRPGFPDRPVFLTITHDPTAYWVGVRMPVDGPDEQNLAGLVLLRADSIFNDNLFFDWRSLVALTTALFAVALVCWLPFVHGTTSSIREMARVTDEIAQGRFDKHVTSRRRDELGHLGGQINLMAGRLDGFVKGQKRFLGDIAHELCAPIARIQFALGILEQKSEEPARGHVAVLQDEVQEMSAMVNELLMFSKAGMQPDETPLSPVDLSGAVRQAVSHQLPGAGTIEVSLPQDVAVVAHEPYLVRAISNLLRNALRYAGEDGPVTVSARREGSQVLITVADHGPGVPEEALEQVFAPFYRPEVARSRATGGAGLGLAIVKSCIDACRGAVACRNREPSGLEVTISLAAAG